MKNTNENVKHINENLIAYRLLYLDVYFIKINR